MHAGGCGRAGAWPGGVWPGPHLGSLGTALGALETVSAIGLNTFSAHIKVKRGDVLAMSNDSSGIYMESAPAGQCVRDFSSTLSNGTTGKPDFLTPQLHLLLSADVHV